MSSHHKAGSTASLNDRLKNEDAEQVETELPENREELQAQLAAAEEKAAQSWERLLRLQAEMENLQRRSERDVSNAHKYALEKFALELLPIVDGLERAVAVHEGEDSSSGTLLDGLNLTLKMIYAAFAKFGIEQINPEGEPFNPEWHQAVSTQVDPDVAPNTILAVLQKGYLLNKRLMRPALVVVSKA